MTDEYNDGIENKELNRLKPLNIKEKNKQVTAIAINAGNDENNHIAKITASGRGKIAEQILQLAFDNGVKVREDSALTDILAKIDIDSPIPSEAFGAIVEILSYVYRANGEPNPFDTVLNDVINKNSKNNQSEI